MLRTKILEASLKFVNFHGWSRKTIALGAESVGYPCIEVVHGMFPEGGIELVQYFDVKCNEELKQRLKEETQNGDIITNKPLTFKSQAVKNRLQMIEPYLTKWPEAIGLKSLRKNIPKSLKQFLVLVDDICYYSGDRSVDIKWYIRRIILAKIYKQVELFMLQDSSVNHEETWKFLNRKLEEISQFEAFAANSEGLIKNIPHNFSLALETTRNIIGLNYNRK